MRNNLRNWRLNSSTTNAPRELIRVRKYSNQKNSAHAKSTLLRKNPATMRFMPVIAATACTSSGNSGANTTLELFAGLPSYT